MLFVTDCIERGQNQDSYNQQNPAQVDLAHKSARRHLRGFINVYRNQSGHTRLKHSNPD
jgi:hypothetical protein